MNAKAHTHTHYSQDKVKRPAKFLNDVKCVKTGGPKIPENM